MTDARLIQCFYRFLQSGISPIENVVVGQGTKVDLGTGQHADVARMHSIVNGFLRPRPVMGGNSGFEVDKPEVGIQCIEFRQGVSPHVAGIPVAGQGAILFPREFHVPFGIPNATPIGRDQGVSGMGQHLIYAASQHDVTAQCQPDFTGFRSRHLFFRSCPARSVIP